MPVLQMPRRDLFSSRSGDATHPASVLIVSGSERARTDIREAMESSRACFLEAETDEEALRMLEGQAVDLILTSVDDVEGGAGQLQKLLTGERSAVSPVIVISREERPDQIQKVLEMGAASYVLRSFLAEALPGEVERQLRTTSVQTQ